MRNIFDRYSQSYTRIKQKYVKFLDFSISALRGSKPSLEPVLNQLSHSYAVKSQTSYVQPEYTTV